MHSDPVFDAVIGLASLGAAPASPSNSSSCPSESSMNGRNTDAVRLKESPEGFDSLRAPFTPRSVPPTFMDSMATGIDRFSVGGRFVGVNRAATSFVSTPPRPSLPYNAYRESRASPPLPASLIKPRIPDQTEPIISTKNFPETLLGVISSKAYSDIISWLPHGRGFVIVDKRRFVSMILPRYFDGAKFTSFTRRLKRWSFVRVARGPELGAYYNKNFVRDQPELVQEMFYRRNGKFEKDKSKDKHKEARKEQSHDAAETEIQESPSSEGGSLEAIMNKTNALEEQVGRNGMIYSSNKVQPRRNCERQRLPSSEEYRQLQQHILSANMVTPETNFPDPRDSPMPLPSTLPKTPKPVAVQKQMRGKHTLASHAKKAKETANIQKNKKCAKNHPNTVDSSFFPKKHPSLASLMSIEEENLPHEVGGNVARPGPARAFDSGNGARSGPACTFGGNNVSRLGSTHAFGVRSTSKGIASSHPYYASASTAQKLIIVERARRFLEAELSKGQNHQSFFGNHSNCPNEDVMASKILVPPKIRISPLDQLVEYSSQSKSFTPRSANWNALAGSRPVMMSLEEEDEFARYLFLRRNDY